MLHGLWVAAHEHYILRIFHRERANQQPLRVSRNHRIDDNHFGELGNIQRP